jgi:hypothetical protein
LVTYQPIERKARPVSVHVVCSECGTHFDAAQRNRELCSPRCRQRKARRVRAERDAAALADIASTLERWSGSLDARGIGTANLTPELPALIGRLRRLADGIAKRAPMTE